MESQISNSNSFLGFISRKSISALSNLEKPLEL